MFDLIKIKVLTKFYSRERLQINLISPKPIDKTLDDTNTIFNHNAHLSIVYQKWILSPQNVIEKAKIIDSPYGNTQLIDFEESKNSENIIEDNFKVSLTILWIYSVLHNLTLYF